MRTEQEWKNLEAENASLRERLEKAEKDAAFWLDALKEVRKTLEIASVTPNGPINDTIWYSNCETLFDFMDAEIERERTARKTAQESLENYKGECTRLQHEVDRLKGAGVQQASALELCRVAIEYCVKQIPEFYTVPGIAKTLEALDALPAAVQAGKEGV